MMKKNVSDKTNISFEDINVVSFDVFDTLLIRDFLYPIDIFSYIEAFLSIKDFQKNRIEAEESARYLHNDQEEIIYKEIYDLLSGYDKNIELKLEKMTCGVNQQIFQIYQEAVALNKKIIAISDMYLPADIIKTLLTICGYSKIDQIFVSSQFRATKGSGKLFDLILNELNINQMQLLHIGDNLLSDYKVPKNRGINAHYFPAMRDVFAGERNPQLLIGLNRHNTPQGSLYGGLLVKTLQERNDKNYWYKFGYEYAGIIIFNFAHYIYEKAKEKHLNSLYFMARDGQIIKRVFDMLFSEDTEITTNYLYASRRLFLLPSITEINNENLAILALEGEETTVREAIERLAIPQLLELANQYFPSLDTKIVSPREREKLKLFFIENEKIILSHAQQEKKSLLKYLEMQGIFQNQNKALIDVGWACSSQKYLEAITGTEISGIYFGTSAGSYQHKNIHGYFFDKGNPDRNYRLAFSCIEIVELLFLGEDYSILKIDDNQKPIYSQKCEFEDIRIKIGKEVQKGIIDFCSDYQKILNKYHLKRDDTLNFLVLNALIVQPTLEDIKQIAVVPHSIGLGISKYTSIINDLDLTIIQRYRKYKKVDRDLWPKGRAQYQFLTNKRTLKWQNLFLFIHRIFYICKVYGLKVCSKKILNKIKNDLKN